MGDKVRAGLSEAWATVAPLHCRPPLPYLAVFSHRTSFRENFHQYEVEMEKMPHPGVSLGVTLRKPEVPFVIGK